MLNKIFSKLGLMKVSTAKYFVGQYNYELSKLTESNSIKKFGDEGVFIDGTYNSHKKSAEDTFDAFMEMGAKETTQFRHNDKSEMIINI